MFRAAILVTMLAIGAGPSASLLCAVWCQGEAVAADACNHREHTDSRLNVSSHSCHHGTPPPTAFTSAERRGVTTQILRAVVFMPATLTDACSTSSVDRELRQSDLATSRPPAAPLRI